MTKPLVSIIIPVYNRAALIGETLDSVLVQTYKNWECLVVDDGSTDTTIAVIQRYCDQDTRFNLYHRPDNKPKGGNAARNFGLEKSQGDYINWFDSDDLMKPTFLQDKVAILLDNKDVDFVISRSVKFYPDGRLDNTSYYENNAQLRLTADNFIQERVHWLTPDLMIRKRCIGYVTFDTCLFSGQEYNFIIKLLTFNTLNGLFLNKKLCNIRKHSQSIQEVLKLDALTAFKKKYIVAQKTFSEVHTSINRESKVFFINRILKLSTPLLLNKKYPPNYLKFFYFYAKNLGFTKGCFLIGYSILLVFGKQSYTLSKKILAN